MENDACGHDAACQAQYGQYGCLPSHAPQVFHDEAVGADGQAQHEQQDSNGERSALLDIFQKLPVVQEAADDDTGQHGTYNAEHNDSLFLFFEVEHNERGGQTSCVPASFDRDMSKRRGGGNLDEPAEPVHMNGRPAAHTWVQAGRQAFPVGYVG